tara:strand:+ start:242 stop:562 length:321 start_codon:yes stop_codon:yes gene_type:complete
MRLFFGVVLIVLSCPVLAGGFGWSEKCEFPEESMVLDQLNPEIHDNPCLSQSVDSNSKVTESEGLVLEEVQQSIAIDKKQQAERIGVAETLFKILWGIVFIALHVI